MTSIVLFLLGPLILASCALNCFGWRRWLRGEQPLAYTPRLPVPWGVVGAVLALCGTGMAVAAALTQDAEADPISPRNLWAMGTVELVLLAVVVSGIAYKHWPSLADWGLPTTGRELLADVRLGLLTFCFALVPVYCVQLPLVTLVSQSTHPLLESLKSAPSGPLLVAAFFAAVIVAPIFEEAAFRLLFQGFLETEWPAEAESSPRVRWAPIVASSLAFVFAHLGNGLDPLPLLPLALILGYVYQRTHRIVPTIIAHAAFNALSLLLFWSLL